MPNTMKQTCQSCRALQWNYPDYLCKLEYKMETVRQLDGSFKNIPLEPCPKPLTFDAYFTIVQDRERADRKKIRRDNLTHPAQKR